MYLRCLYVINRCDLVHLDEVDRLAHAPDTVVISCKDALNLDLLLEKIWEYLNFIRIYTKPRGQRPDFSDVSCQTQLLHSAEAPRRTVAADGVCARFRNSDACCLREFVSL